MSSQKIFASHRSFRNALRRYSVVLAIGPALAACSGWPHTRDTQNLATYDPPMSVVENGGVYEPPTRGNYLVERWNLGMERRAAQSHEPAVAALNGTPIPTTFLQSLNSDYSSFATSLDVSQHQWADADYFSRKGLGAADAQPVPPEDNRNWLIPGQYRPMLADARLRLVTDLDNGGRDRAPAIAARAQVSYDCWVEHMETNSRTALNGNCHKQFDAAMNRLEMRSTQASAVQPAATYQYQVYFDFDKYNLTPEAQQMVGRVAQQVQKEPDLHVTLVGKADRAGTDAYNMALSKRRAERVRAELDKDGVSENHIDVTWDGEREPPVPTPNGVREPRNRVVEVTTYGPNQEVSQR